MEKTEQTAMANQIAIKQLTNQVKQNTCDICAKKQNQAAAFALGAVWGWLRPAQRKSLLSLLKIVGY